MNNFIDKEQNEFLIMRGDGKSNTKLYYFIMDLIHKGIIRDVEINKIPAAQINNKGEE